MTLLLQIIFFFLSCLTNPESATPVFSKVTIPNYTISFSKTENVKEESVVKIGVQNFAGSGISENSFFQKGTSTVSYALFGASRASEREVVNGVGNIVPNSLIIKLTQQGADKLKAWTSARTLNYKSLNGSTHAGISAEAKIFEDLESAIGNKNVLSTIEDGQGRLSIVLERTGQTHQVVSVHPTSTGELKMTTFEPAYNPNLNTSIPVPASVNKLVPDYATTQYLHSLNQGKVIRIEMSGTRATDFTRANAELGVASKPLNYTWHHLDDFEVVNGKVYCTMQLVQSSAHGGSGISGLVHTGSVAQWKAYFGTTVYP